MEVLHTPRDDPGRTARTSDGARFRPRELSDANAPCHQYDVQHGQYRFGIPAALRLLARTDARLAGGGRLPAQ